MSSYFASLTSSTTISSLGTRLNSLRRAITSGEERDDPENEDCSHISNVLRAYYTEKGLPFPQWLPPDPKTPVPQPRMIATQASLQQSNNPYGSVPGQPTSRGGGLGDLWGDGPSQPPPTQTASLRNRPARTPPISRRPLPSQRAGSYQTTSSSHSSLGLERGNSGGSSAQERLRARFHGGSGASSPSPPPQAQSQAYEGGYARGQNSGGGGGYKRPGLPNNPRAGGYR
ncbi:hypothetical protein BGW36DRAFT_299384 [Talaromyces proteolyticus]|uniref:Mso1 N-terminal domain-containing protein n=1 Tax=Talaromyces proteolyticus TaxID=1131652 RepID=A0AAD4KSP3_9EURO|nr:uncharacterized protein BGW36DRAFT_299384 [Talaromyces proteolyticus]KAH8695120.1 hypothetical protein BGW36DRAFT_299384 [Talaromyces proteolyticus]